VYTIHHVFSLKLLMFLAPTSELLTNMPLYLIFPSKIIILYDKIFNTFFIIEALSSRN